MRIPRYITMVLLITLVALSYVHQQIEVVKLSYEIQSNTHRLNDLLDQNEILQYNVIALMAPSNLENRLLDNDIRLVMPERWQVVRVASSGPDTQALLQERRTLPRLYAFLRDFALGREAQAKPSID